MTPQLVRNALFAAILTAGFFASREATLRGQYSGCYACTGIFGETCEPCEGGEDCGKYCFEEPFVEECTIAGEICWADG
jgi:hypothetical protein